jgi:hypothetical protein
MTQVLLIHPPVSKPGEPPAGVARIRGALAQNRISCSVIDANLDGIHFLLGTEVHAEDAWTKNASRGVGQKIHELRTESAFRSVGHYNRIVNDLNRLLSVHGRKTGHQLGLADMTHPRLSPVRSGDLVQCAEHPENDPFYDYYESLLLPAIAKQAPAVAGISVNFLSQAFSAFALVSLIRKRLPGLPVVLGGGLITSWMRNPGWTNPFAGLVDACVAGPGEPYFLSRFGIGTDREPAAPLYDGMEGLPYLSPGFVLPYDASSGCWWRQCRFCPEPAEGNPYRPVPDEVVLSNLSELKGKTGPSLVHFLDNALSPSLLERLIESPPGMPWYGYVRFTGHLIDPDFCVRLKRSGCVLLKLGLESGDPQVLDKMGKGIQIQAASKILRNLAEAGIRTYVYLLFGTPYESKAEAEKTMAFTVEHGSSIGFLNAAIFNMPVSSPEASALATRPFFEGDLSLYTDFQHPAGWNRRKVRDFLDRTFRRHPIIAPILARTPKFFTSNHAPFFCMHRTNGISA